MVAAVQRRRHGLAVGAEALGAAGGATIAVASDGTGEGASFTGVLGPDQAVWLRQG